MNILSRFKKKKKIIFYDLSRYTNLLLRYRHRVTAQYEPLSSCTTQLENRISGLHVDRKRKRTKVWSCVYPRLPGIA